MFPGIVWWKFHENPFSHSWERLSHSFGGRKKTKKNKTKTKNICKTYMHPPPTGRRLRKQIVIRSIDKNSGSNFFGPRCITTRKQPSVSHSVWRAFVFLTHESDAIEFLRGRNEWPHCWDNHSRMWQLYGRQTDMIETDKQTDMQTYIQTDRSVQAVGYGWQWFCEYRRLKISCHPVGSFLEIHQAWPACEETVITWLLVETNERPEGGKYGRRSRGQCRNNTWKMNELTCLNVA